MSRNEQTIRLLMVPVIALTFACGGDGADDSDTGGAAAADAVQVDPSTAGSVVGTVSFEGQPPEGDPIDMSEEPACAEKHSDQPRTRPVVVGSDGGLQNVFIHVTQGLPEGSWPAADEAVELDQDGCIYEPHVLAVRTGQTLTIRNSDGILHNINARPENQRGFNISQPAVMTTDRTFSQPEVMIPIQCDVHGWMEAYLGVVEHPYFAVTSEDGTFEIGNLPPGDYVIEAWHERYGTQTQNVTVAESGEATADFSYSASMAGAVVPLGDPIDLHDHATAGSAGGGL
ncbi:MAG TPA: carboxypeptidase regulatory-like domain-containing protein [Longimicrobiales bacterium]|nr:carboxypeptidase regulatory-like domain-containing protein [Longimicrobiales bacterium]